MDENMIDREDPQYQLHCIRHSAAHIMAHAVQDLFPGSKFAIGPVIKDGFYYDMDLSRALTTEDLEAIEKRMKEIVKENNPFMREEWDKEQAIRWFDKMVRILNTKSSTVLPMKRSRFIKKAILPISAPAPMYAIPSSASILNCSRFQEPIGVVTKRTPCCNAFMAPPGKPKKI